MPIRKVTRVVAIEPPRAENDILKQVAASNELNGRIAVVLTEGLDRIAEKMAREDEQINIRANINRDARGVMQSIDFVVRKDMIIDTIRGPMHERELRKVVVKSEDAKAFYTAVEHYTYSGELVKRSAHVQLKKGLEVKMKLGD